MPLSTSVLIESPLLVKNLSDGLIQKASPQRKVLDLLSGVVYAAFDIALSYQVIIRRSGARRMIENPRLQVDAVRVVNGTFLEQYSTHPALLAIFGFLTGSLKEAFERGVELYGPMPIGEESVLLQRTGFTLRSLDWDFIDQLTAKLLASTYLQAESVELDMNLIFEGVKAHQYNRGYLEQVAQFRDGKPLLY